MANRRADQRRVREQAEEMRRHERQKKLLETLKDMPLCEFTVGDLIILIKLVFPIIGMALVTKDDLDYLEKRIKKK